MKIVKSIVCLVLIVTMANAFNLVTEKTIQHKPGDPFDEITVESSLNIRKKVNPVRRTRNIAAETFGLRELVRTKRQGRRNRPFGTQSSSAQAAANSNFFNRQGFGASAANSQAQGFQSQGPLGGFGASATNAQTQSFTAGRNGLQGSAGLSGSQVYNLPNGQSINLAYSNGFSVGPDGRPAVSQGNSLTFNNGRN